MAGALVMALAAAVGLAVGEADARAVWWSAAVAYTIQLVAFAAIAAARGKGNAFLAAWGGGTLLRFGAVTAAGVWLARSGAHPPLALLLSLAGFLLLLLFLEAVFFARGLRSR